MKRLLSALACALVVSAMTPPSISTADERTIGSRVDDALITASVKTKLAAEHAKNLVNVNVDSQDGIVHLQGSVPTADDKTVAEHLARGVKGVRGVTNDLRVEASGSTPSASPRY
jgi:osmotically-inducible protein OsmY